MIPYRELLRICEGNKQLARSTQAYLKSQETLTIKQWKDNVRPLMLQAEKDILNQLKSYSLTDWQTFNLKNILDQVQQIINRFDGQFRAEQPRSSRELINLSNNFMDKNAQQISATFSLTPKLTDDILLSLIPLSDVFINNFTSDMAKIIKSEISLGVINASSISEVAKKIQEKFLSSDMSYARAERIAQTEMLRAASLAQDVRAKQIAKDNPKVRKAWISMHKPRARITHIETESATRENPIPVDEEFVVGGERAMYPRDPQLSAKNSVNCACMMVLVNPEDK